MTRDEILAMKPGREMDALVARTVLGLEPKWVASEPWVSTSGPSVLDFYCNFGGAVYTADRDWLVDDYWLPDCRRRLPDYSTDIAAAWKVVENILRESEVYVCSGVVVNGESGWRATVESELGLWEADAPTAPEAICKAALMAVMDDGG